MLLRCRATLQVSQWMTKIGHRHTQGQSAIVNEKAVARRMINNMWNEGLKQGVEKPEDTFGETAGLKYKNVSGDDYLRWLVQVIQDRVAASDTGNGRQKRKTVMEGEAALSFLIERLGKGGDVSAGNHLPLDCAHTDSVQQALQAIAAAPRCTKTAAQFLSRVASYLETQEFPFLVLAQEAVQLGINLRQRALLVNTDEATTPLLRIALARAYIAAKRYRHALTQLDLVEGILVDKPDVVVPVDALILNKAIALYDLGDFDACRKHLAEGKKRKNVSAAVKKMLKEIGDKVKQVDAVASLLVTSPTELLSHSVLAVDWASLHAVLSQHDYFPGLVVADRAHVVLCAMQHVAEAHGVKGKKGKKGRSVHKVVVFSDGEEFPSSMTNAAALKHISFTNTLYEAAHPTKAAGKTKKKTPPKMTPCLVISAANPTINTARQLGLKHASPDLYLDIIRQEVTDQSEQTKDDTHVILEESERLDLHYPLQGGAAEMPTTNSTSPASRRAQNARSEEVKV